MGSAIGAGRASGHEGPELRTRVKPRVLPADEAITTFDEVIVPYTPEEAAREARRVLDVGFDLERAREGCPFRVDLPAVVREVAAGNVDEALGIILQSHPFPSIFGRMCHDFCERAVPPVLGIEGPALRELERFVGDYGDRALFPVVLEGEPSGKHVAVIGAGSGGVAGTWMLRRLGHEVDLYDPHDVPGGMLVTGYSPWRMPRYAVRRDNDPVAWGARFFGGVWIDRPAFERIVDEYDLVLLATGLPYSYRLNIPSEDAEGVWTVLDFIWHVSNGLPVGQPRRVLVIGAGQASLDASRSARRLGAEVTICYRRTREWAGIGHESRRYEQEFPALEAEGVRCLFLVQPTRILADAESRVTGVQLVRTQLGTRIQPDGKPEIREVPGSDFVMDCDMVIKAIGEGIDRDLFPEWLEVADGKLVVDKRTHRTSHPKVFAAGDIVGDLANEGATLAAMHAAQTMDSLLRGEPLVTFKPRPLRRGRDV